jgi:uncharacterized protein YoxC
MNDDQAQTDDQSRHDGVILEDIQDKLARILEATDALRDVPAKINTIDERLVNVEADVKTIKAAVTDTSRQVKDHGVRIAHLEQAA